MESDMKILIEFIAGIFLCSASLGFLFYSEFLTTFLFSAFGIISFWMMEKEINKSWGGN